MDIQGTFHSTKFGIFLSGVDKWHTLPERASESFLDNAVEHMFEYLKSNICSLAITTSTRHKIFTTLRNFMTFFYKLGQKFTTQGEMVKLPRYVTVSNAIR